MYPDKKDAKKQFENESELWKSFINGDEHAYESIYRQYASLLYRYGNKISNDAELVEDCIQDLFIKMWMSKSRLSDTPYIKNYLLKAFRHLLLDFTKRKKSKMQITGDPLDFKLTLALDQEDAQQQGKLEKEQKLQAAMEKLSSRQKEVIYLRFYKKLRNEEIAEVMEISVASVYNLVSKALIVLESHLYLFSILLFSSP